MNSMTGVTSVTDMDRGHGGEPRQMGALAGSGAAHPAWLWRSGALVPWDEARVHVNAVGHASVAAVFEGIKGYLAADGERLLVFRLDDHLRRFAESARLCRLTLPYDTGRLRDAVLELLVANGFRQDVYLRPWAFPEGIVREAMVPADARCEVAVDSWTFDSSLESVRGCRAAVSSWRRIGEAAMPPRAKAFSNYHNGRMALMEVRENGHDWPIMLNERGQVAEGASACVALVRDGTLLTPSLSSGVLPGITRDTVLSLARDLGIPVEEREVDRSELYLADEIFFMGTAWEILPVAAIDGMPVGGTGARPAGEAAPGPVARRLLETYRQLVRGMAGASPWLTEVKPA
ncbi:aminotransferase class IV [Streptomyces sp. WMMB303]|uniref:aminotransferase class IV n=1 Tax=Streptomyces sp. WMMB303 TaxID=3034154 RepID=UPI0023EA8FC6|nr:aminotransferase class IV [Streptomyces sp. WMMB303]MDF4251740.1 aminotransferase class IV [Streptomyces sp. WMMB303]